MISSFYSSWKVDIENQNMFFYLTRKNSKWNIIKDDIENLHSCLLFLYMTNDFHVLILPWKTFKDIFQMLNYCRTFCHGMFWFWKPIFESSGNYMSSTALNCYRQPEHLYQTLSTYCRRKSETLATNKVSSPFLLNNRSLTLRV